MKRNDKVIITGHPPIENLVIEKLMIKRIYPPKGDAESVLKVYARLVGSGVSKLWLGSNKDYIDYDISNLTVV